MLSSLTFGLLNSACLSSLLMLLPADGGRLGKAELFNGFALAGATG